MNGSELIRALGAGIRPVQNAAPGAQTPDSISGASFSSLLSRASSAGSGLPVTIAPGAGVELSPEQLTRLAAATDAAERQGATRALILLDGSAYRVDVGVRSITGKADLGAGVVTGIDAVIVAQEAPHAASPAHGLPGPAASDAPGILPLPAATPSSSVSLLRALQQDQAT